MVSIVSLVQHTLHMIMHASSGSKTTNDMTETLQSGFMLLQPDGMFT